MLGIDSKIGVTQDLRNTLEEHYRHIPPERSPVSYPLNPRAVCPTPIHSGAECYFTDAKYLSKTVLFKSYTSQYEL
jgi:hypothetical protein